MSEELLQNGLNRKNPTSKIGKWDFYNIGATTIKNLKEYGIIRSIDYGKYESKKVDALIVQQKNVIAVIEYKKPSEFKTEAQKKKAINQEIEVARVLKSKIIIATDTQDTVWVNVLTGKNIKDEQGKNVKELFNPNDKKTAQLIEKINESISERNNQIKPKELVNPTGLAKSIWQDIWSVSGESPTNCLYTFVELFIFKYLSDLKILGQGVDFDSLMERFEYDLENPNEEALEYYAATIRPKIKKLFPYNPSDNTTIINGTVFVNKDDQPVTGYSTVFKKVLKKFQDHPKLENIEHDFKSQLFEEFLKEGISKKNLGQYFTPLKVVRSIVKMAKDDIKAGVSICDPACGVGKFLLEPVLSKLDEFYTVKNGKLKSNITIHGFDKGFDKDEQKTIILAKANMLIYLSDKIKENPNITDQFSKVFNESFTLKTENILGTLADPVRDTYDLILTNPPYVTSGSSNLKDEIKKNAELSNYYKVSARGLEGLFMEWIIRALKPGGKAFVVIPDGILSSQNNLRKFILDECYIDGIISLPLNTFFTVSKKTYILAITKKESRQDIQAHPVFTYLVSEIGESRDIYRFDIDQNDLQDAVIFFNQFKGSKEHFKTDEGRCKIQPIQKFQDNIETSWTIDKWWSEDDKIKLGIIKKQKRATILEFASMIEFVADSMKEMQKEIEVISQKKKIEIEYKSFKVTDLFNIERGSGTYIKKYINLNKGEHPVYSGNTFGEFAFINTYDYDLKCLSWAIDGLAGYMMIHYKPFSATNHRGILKPKYKDLNLKYLKYVLEPIFRKEKKGRIGDNGKNEYTALPPFMIKDIEIQLPVLSSGDLDIETQNELAEKISFVEGTKQKIEKYKKQINDLVIEIKLSNQRLKTIKALSLIDVLPVSNKISKKHIQKGGKYPVFSSQTTEAGLVGYSDLKMFDASKRIPLITFGDHTRIFFIHKTPFSVLDNVKVLKIKDEFKNLIDIEFLIYVWQPQIQNLGYSRHWKEAKNVKIKMPIDKNGNFDLQAQKEIAEKYKKIENIKNGINDELDKISETEINL